MANWYSTYFETRDNEILKFIENGQTTEFNYDEKNGNGYCELRCGLSALDINAIEKYAINNCSSFFIRASDSMDCQVHTWAYENGKEIIAEIKEVEPVFHYTDDDGNEISEEEFIERYCRG
jgi:hypothetical protein